MKKAEGDLERAWGHKSKSWESDIVAQIMKEEQVDEANARRLLYIEWHEGNGQRNRRRTRADDTGASSEGGNDDDTASPEPKRHRPA